MDIVFIDTNEKMVEAWKRAGAEEYALVQHGDLLEVDTDALVAPGNSFGFMDGGLDNAIRMRFGMALEKNVQITIHTGYNKELLVGQSLVIQTFDKHVGFCIYAPTTRVPMCSADSVAPFLSTRSALDGAMLSPYIHSVSFPGMGAGLCGLDVDVVAEQMLSAIRWIQSSEDDRFPEHVVAAEREHKRLLAGGK